MKITDLLGYREIVTDDIAYFLISDSSVNIYYEDGSTDAIVCSTHYNAMFAARELYRVVRKDVITLADRIGTAYYINVTKLTSRRLNGLTIYLTFANVPDLIISSWKIEDAATDFEYVDEIYKARTFLDWFDGTFREVGSGKTYATIALARAAASAGDCIRVYPGTYAENPVMLNGAYYYFEEGTTVDGKWTEPSAHLQVRIYGYGTFISTEEIYEGFYGLGSINGLVVWEFEEMKSDSYRPFFSQSGRAKNIIKGYKSGRKTPGDNAASFIDTDDSIELDMDMLEVNDAEAVVFLAYTNRPRRLKIRNVLHIADSPSSNYLLESGQVTSENRVVIDILNNWLYNNPAVMDPETRGVNVSDWNTDTLSPFSRVILANSVFSAGNNQTRYNISSAYDDQVWETIGINYFSNGFYNVALDKPQYIIDPRITSLPVQENVSSNLITEVMPLSGMPTVSKFQVGQEVFFFIGDTLCSSTIKQVRSRVTNVANNDEGELVHYYSFNDYAIELEESKIYITQRFALFVKGGASVYGNSFKIANGTGVTWNADMTAMDFSNTNFTVGNAVTWANAITDGANFDSATMPDSVNTLAEFKAVVASYDKATTIWMDGDPIGDR